MEENVSIKSKIKELFNHGLIYGLTSSLQSILGFLLLPILTTYYSPAEFGVYSIILLASALASAIFYFGASSALGRYYYDEDTTIYRRQIVSTALFVTIFGAILLVLFSVLFGKKLSILLFSCPDYHLHLVLAFSGAAFGFLLNTMTLLLRYEKRSKLFMIITLTGVVINFIITYLLLTRFHLGVLAPLYGSFFSMGLCFFYLLILKFSDLTFNIKWNHVKKILSFGLQLSVSGLLFYFLDYVDRLIMKDLLPMSDVGIYSLGCRIGVIINVILILPFSLIWAPIRMQYANSNNQKFTITVASYLAIIGFIIVAVSVLFGEEMMRLIFSNNKYADAAKVFPLIMLSLLFYGFQNIIDFGIYINNKIYFFIIISLIGIGFNILMNYWLIPYFGFIASAYVTFLTYFITTSLIYLISSRYHKMELEWKRIIIPFFVLIILYFSVNFSGNIIFINFYFKLFIMLLILGSLYSYWLVNTERQIIKQIIRKKDVK